MSDQNREEYTYCMDTQDHQQYRIWPDHRDLEVEIINIADNLLVHEWSVAEEVEVNGHGHFVPKHRQ